MSTKNDRRRSTYTDKIVGHRREHDRRFLDRNHVHRINRHELHERRNRFDGHR